MSSDLHVISMDTMYVNVHTPNKKKGKGKTPMAVLTQMDVLANKFEKEFSLVSCLSATITCGVWFVDGGASCHMISSCG